MTASRAIAVVAVVVASRLIVLAQQPLGTGALSGIVTNESGTQAVRAAYVLLIGTTTGVLKVSSSDRDGRFTFTGLPADRYTVGASKPPYLGAVAGAKRPARPGVSIAVAAGQQITNVTIRLPLGAAISGVITDERGRPAAGASTALQQWRMQGTQRALVQVGTTSTDDRGAYRFPGLVPGEYVVSATRTSMVPAAVASMFFPGTPRASDAQIIAVTTGEDRRNVDFRLEVVWAAQIDGVVLAAGNPSLANLAVQLRSAGPLTGPPPAARVAADGRFFLPNVPPGSYRLQVTGTGGLTGQFASVEIDVAGSDISGVQLAMKPALTFSGTLMFQGAGPGPSVAGRRVPLRNLSPTLAGSPQPQISTTDNAGRFTVTNVIPGRFLLGGSLAFGPNSDTINWALSSVTVDGQDVTDLPIDITDSAPRDVVVTYSDEWQELSGRLQSASGAPVSDVTIVVFSENPAYWYHGSRRIVAARPDTAGYFSLSGRGPATLPPGRYLLATVPDLARDEQYDPAFLSALIPGTIPIGLQPGERKTQDLRVR